jgi:hypothetical protein
MKQKVTNIFLSLLIIGGLSAWIYRNEDKPKTYSVVLTLDQWNTQLKYIQNAKTIMQKSTMPANIVSDWADSLNSVANQISLQVGQQLQEEQKKDSTKPKKP